jgi:hypothetical protein
LFVLILLAADLGLVYFPSQGQGFNRIRSIYLDFRSRLVGLVTGSPEQNLDNFLRSQSSAISGGRASGPHNELRFFYVDGHGEIHFVTSLDEIPPVHRDRAQKLER